VSFVVDPPVFSRRISASDQCLVPQADRPLLYVVVHAARRSLNQSTPSSNSDVRCRALVCSADTSNRPPDLFETRREFTSVELFPVVTALASLSAVVVQLVVVLLI